MGTFLIILLVIGGTGAVAYFVTRSSKRSKKPKSLTSDFRSNAPQLETELGERSLTDLKLNDIVCYYENDFTVEGMIAYNQGGWKWYTYRLEDAGEQRWLGIEQDDGLEVQLWEEVEEFEVSAPPPQTIEYDGETFRRVEKGRANAESVGRTGRAVKASVSFYDYNGSNGRYLSVEDWDGDIEVSVGRDVDPMELTVLPGDNVAA